MTRRDRGIAFFCVTIWGLNFPVTAVALQQFTPMTVLACRFLLVAIPTIIWVHLPKTRLRWLFLYGATYGFGQFAAVYIGMALGAPAGLAAILIQSSAPFTVLLGRVVMKENIGSYGFAGVAIASISLIGIGSSSLSRGFGLGALVVILAGLSWAIGNLCVRMSGTNEPFRFTLWMSVIPPIPALLIGLLLRGIDGYVEELHGLLEPQGIAAIVAVLYISAVATIGATGAWAFLMSKYQASAVAPMTLLMPVIALFASWLMIGEEPRLWDLVLAVFVICGVWLTSKARPLIDPSRDAG